MNLIRPAAEYDALPPQSAGFCSDWEIANRILSAATNHQTFLPLPDHASAGDVRRTCLTRKNHLSLFDCFNSSWMRGSSPRMTSSMWRA